MVGALRALCHNFTAGKRQAVGTHSKQRRATFFDNTESLKALRRPLEHSCVTIRRAGGPLACPAGFMLIVAMPPADGVILAIRCAIQRALRRRQGQPQRADPPSSSCPTARSKNPSKAG
ncbi:ATP-binding protein [Chthoniobacter flavus]